MYNMILEYTDGSKEKYASEITLSDATRISEELRSSEEGSQIWEITLEVV